MPLPAELLVTVELASLVYQTTSDVVLCAQQLVAIDFIDDSNKQKCYRYSYKPWRMEVKDWSCPNRA